ncbi:uncharacterized protein LOC108116804 [Drosophila eugracilis]|uniref:uncharacterized protein LOC108116804 n=1 Tax=Drosophila eugracilis TaxID=29029 RepID=UPI001BDAF285|nr:uncharacterized protein LOC108116804 [Drosophila eugracilis]
MTKKTKRRKSEKEDKNVYTRNEERKEEYSRRSDENLASFELTNVVCTSMDESFSSFEYCYIKSVNRTYKYGSLKVNLHKVPIWKIKVNAALYQRLNGYKPFLYNITVDGCKFIKNQKYSPVASFIFNLFAPYSNMNHSCPYDHDVIVDKVPTSYLNHQLTNVLPFPASAYGFYSDWYAGGIKRASVNVYGTLT